ncbi:NACHT domain-containing protein [Glycomyces sp. NPDC047369]
MTTPGWLDTLSTFVLPMLTLATAVVAFLTARLGLKKARTEAPATLRKAWRPVWRLRILLWALVILAPNSLGILLDGTRYEVPVTFSALAAMIVLQFWVELRFRKRPYLVGPVYDLLESRIATAPGAVGSTGDEVAYLPNSLAPVQDRALRYPISKEAPESDEADRIEFWQLLDEPGNGHLLLTGEAGVGKTALLRHRELRSWQEWRGYRMGDMIARSHLALRIRALDLIGADSLAAAIAPSMPHLFEHRPARKALWLIMVDGLDEIADDEDRARVERLIRMAAEQPRRTYRIVATTRGLTDDRRRRFRAAGFHEYAVQPFTRSELRGFLVLYQAGGYERLDDPEFEMLLRTRALRFSLRMLGVGLLDVIRLPLLAKIAADIYFSEEDRVELPARRVDIYETAVARAVARFEPRITTGGTGSRERGLLERWSREHGGAPERPLSDTAFAFLRELAHRHLADPRRHLADLACEMLAVPLRPKSGENWTAVARLLECTGLVHDATTARAQFLHQTFAEYLAAPLRIDHRRGPAEWAEHLADPERRIAAAFEFALLGADRRRALQNAMIEAADGEISAAWLLAQGLAGADEEDAGIRTRIAADLAAGLDPQSPRTGVVDAVFRLLGLDEMVDAVSGIATDPEASQESRLVAVQILALHHSARITGLLRELALESDSAVIRARAVTALRDQQSDFSEGLELLRALLATVDPGPGSHGDESVVRHAAEFIGATEHPRDDRVLALALLNHIDQQAAAEAVKVASGDLRDAVPLLLGLILAVGGAAFADFHDELNRVWDFKAFSAEAIVLELVELGPERANAVLERVEARPCEAPPQRFKADLQLFAQELAAEGRDGVGTLARLAPHPAAFMILTGMLRTRKALRWARRFVPGGRDRKSAPDEKIEAQETKGELPTCPIPNRGTSATKARSVRTSGRPERRPTWCTRTAGPPGTWRPARPRTASSACTSGT